MTIATAIFLIAVGAILRYAINVDSDVIDIQTVGVIVRVVDLVLGLVLMSRRRPAGGAEPYG